MDASLGIIFGIITMVCWGTADFFVAKAVRSTSVFKTFLWSQITGVIIFFAIFSLFFRLPLLSLYSVAVIALMGFLGVVSYLAFYKGLQIGKVSIVSPVTACWGAVTFVLSLLFLDESVTLLQILGVCLAILGAVMVSFRWHDLIRTNMKSAARGAKYGAIAALAWGVYYVFFDTLVPELGWFLPIFLVKTVSVFYFLAYLSAAREPFSFPGKASIFVILIGILEAIGFLSYGAGVASEYTAIVAPVSSAFPAVTILLARIFFREKLEINQKIGVASVLAGLVLLSL